MINSKLYIYYFVKVLIPLLLGGLVFEECQTEGEDLVTSISNCNTVTDIEGVYNCTGECIIIGDDGKKDSDNGKTKDGEGWKKDPENGE